MIKKKFRGVTEADEEWGGKATISNNDE